MDETTIGESRFNEQQPEIFKEEALEIINSLKFGDHESFTYHGTDFLIILCSQEDIDSSANKEEIVVTQSTIKSGGYDIYILDSLSIDKKRRIVFYEIIKANLLDQGFKEVVAHRLAKEAELGVYDKSGELE